MTTAPISLRDWLRYCYHELGCRGIDLSRMRDLWKSVHQERGPFVVKYKNYILPNEFSTRRQAERWARWNYKGVGGYQIFPKTNCQGTSQP